MTAIRTYSGDIVLCDAATNLRGLLESTFSRFTEKFDVHLGPNCLEVVCETGDFPWLFVPEFDKRVRMWQVETGITESFAVVEMDNSHLLVNRYILVPAEKVL